jgi:hypothetical protein
MIINNLSSKDIDAFFGLSQTVLTDRKNNRFKREEISNVYSVNDQDGMYFWIVVTSKNGVNATLTVNGINRQLLNYGEPPANLNNIPSKETSKT